ncbi:ATP-dependent helicase [Rothia terrae]|uniref:ATP-dependent helicase n=1 Tax=Rothia terrae TaxID=396015 RepID=UPI003815DEEB
MSTSLHNTMDAANRLKEVSGVHFIAGAPGTGKTRALIERAAQFIESGGNPARLLVLTPSRASATRVREELTARVNTTMSSAPVRAWQAYAFDVLRRAHILELLPGLEFAPKLLSGPEQDVMIRELLEGHRQSGFGPHWPTDLSEALPTNGFRHEIRDFFDRMAEYNLDAGAVQELASRYQHPEWAAAAQLYTEYRQIRRLRAPNAFDPAALIHEAARVFVANPEFLADERAAFDLILIDDLQEASPSIYRLLSIVCGHQLSLVLAQTAQNMTVDADALAQAFTVEPTVYMTACTDTVVQGFRGARPDMIARVRDIFTEVNVHKLKTSYRMNAEIAGAWSALAHRIPPAVAGLDAPRILEQPEETELIQQELLPLGDDQELLDLEKSAGNDLAVEALTVDSPQHEGALLAQMILEDRLHRGRSYRRSAIIVRNGADISRLKRVLDAQGIPVEVSAAETPVRDEPAVRPFLDALALIINAAASQPEDDADGALTMNTEGSAAHDTEADTAAENAQPSSSYALGYENAVALLSSRLGGASTMDIRNLRQLLRGQELRAGGSRSSETLLVECLTNLPMIPRGRDGAAARRVAKVLSAGTEALHVPGATAETVLWALWDASGLAEMWREISAENSTAGQRAHRDLDAMIGLFEAATRYVDQMPGATAAQFLEYIDSQDLPMDTLATRSTAQDAVALLTPATAAGRTWDIVYVAGLQDGVWPNTTIRGSLLSTQELIDTVEFGGDIARTMTISQRIRDTRYDEYRMFSTAISRAEYRLVCTAASSADDMPSELIDIVAPAVGEKRVNTEVRRPLTLRALVAELRQWVAEEDRNPVRAHHAAVLLNRLNNPEQTAGVEVPGAHPASWWGLLPLSSSGPIFTREERVRISPSRVETIHRSPLDWFVQAARAEALTDVSRSIGSLVHAIAEDLPQGTEAELLAELRTRFETLHLPDTWETQQQFDRAQEMMRRFASYVQELSTNGRELVGVEGSFSVIVPGPAKDAILSGRVDRLEVDQAGKFVIIDLKTGKSKPTKKDLEVHPQLAAYQVALEAGAGQQMNDDIEAIHEGKDHPYIAEDEMPELVGLHEMTGGAWLIQLGDKSTKVDTFSQKQEPLNPDTGQWAIELINRAAELISYDTYQARHTADGGFSIGCKLPEICPLCARGRQVTQ